jgi:hypothetical protein
LNEGTRRRAAGPGGTTQAAKTALFAAGNEAGLRENRHRRFSPINKQKSRVATLPGQLRFKTPE